MSLISWEDFDKVDIRAGTIVKVEVFERAKKPAYKIWVDFGDELGVKQTSAQVTAHYKPEELIGRQVAGCINLGDKNIAGFTSEFLLVGFSNNEGEVSLPRIEPVVPNGKKLH